MCTHSHYKEELYLYDNKLNGTIPTELGLLSNMGWLSLYWNQLTGKIPSELGLLSNLELLVLDTNQLTGAVPTSLASLPSLSKSVTLFQYRFFITVLTHVHPLLITEELYLQGNDLTGSLDAFCDIGLDWFVANTCGQPVEINCSLTCCTHCCDATQCCDASGFCELP